MEVKLLLEPVVSAFVTTYKAVDEESEISVPFVYTLHAVHALELRIMR